MIYTLFFGMCSLCIWCIMWFGRKRASEPPDLSGKLPLIGHAYRFIGDSAKIYKTIIKFSEDCTSIGGVMCIYMGPWKMYFLTDPEDSLTVANACVDKTSIVYGFAKPFLGNGLVTAHESIWKRHRKLLNPAFSQSVLNGFIPMFNSQSRILVDQFAEEVGKPFDHEDLLRLNNLETICLTAFGIGGKEFSDMQKRYIPMMNKFLIIMSERFKKAWLYADFTFKWSTLKKEQDELAKSFMELSNTILQVTKKDRKKMETVEMKSSKLKPFMELILDLTNTTGCFTDEEIREETNNIVAAGHDTSATILTFLFTILGSYPDIQHKVYNEVSEVFNGSDSINKDDLSKLVYTEAVIKETIRLYPIAPLVARNVNKRLKLKNFILEPNTTCIIGISAINRHSIWGADADQFRPERWLEPASLPDLDYFGGFGLGKRGCIGKVYATMSMKITIAHVLRRYYILSDFNKMVLKWDIMTRPKSGHFITLELRK